MNYLLLCANLVATVVGAIWIVRQPRPKPPAKLDPASYNLAMRDAGEILRDIRVECGIAVGENVVIEEALDRIRKCFK